MKTFLPMLFVICLAGSCEAQTFGLGSSTPVVVQRSYSNQTFGLEAVRFGPIVRRAQVIERVPTIAAPVYQVSQPVVYQQVGQVAFPVVPTYAPVRKRWVLQRQCTPNGCQNVRVWR